MTNQPAARLAAAPASASCALRLLIGGLRCRWGFDLVVSGRSSRSPKSSTKPPAKSRWFGHPPAAHLLLTWLLLGPTVPAYTDSAPPPPAAGSPGSCRRWSGGTSATCSARSSLPRTTPPTRRTILSPPPSCPNAPCSRSAHTYTQPATAAAAARPAAAAARPAAAAAPARRPAAAAARPALRQLRCLSGAKNLRCRGGSAEAWLWRVGLGWVGGTDARRAASLDRRAARVRADGRRTPGRGAQPAPDTGVGRWPCSCTPLWRIPAAAVSSRWHRQARRRWARPTW